MNKQRPLVGIILNEADKEFYSRSIYCLQKELFAADIDVAIFSSALCIDNKEYSRADTAVYDLISSDLLDGLMIYPSSIYANEERKQEVIEKIRKCGKPVVICDAVLEGIVSETYNYKDAVDCIVGHVLNTHGAKVVDYVGGPDDIYHNLLDEYFFGSFKTFGCELPVSRIHHGTDWDTGYDKLVDEMVANGLPEAVVCCSNISAAGIISELLSRGYEVPGQVIVTGFAKNEPHYCDDYIGLTSIVRDSCALSVNAARRMISMLKGKDFVASTAEEFTLELGISCGCKKSNLANLSKYAVNSTTDFLNGFGSPYNFMAEELTGCDSLESYLWKLNWYTHFLGDYKGLWICLSHNCMHESKPTVEFSEKMDLVLSRCDGKSSVDFERSFRLNDLLPAITEPREKPAAFIFTALHFCGNVYGYMVVSYGDDGRVYDRNFVKWTRTAVCALVQQHKHILYNDSVIDSQIRDSLTGLLNMRGYYRIMKAHCGKFDDSSKIMRIVSVDVENLKGINEAYGYAEGDKVLSRIGLILSRCAEDNDICVRVSGDEFFVAGILNENSLRDTVLENIEHSIEMFNAENAKYGISLYTARVSAPLTSPDVLETLPYEASYQRKMNKDSHAIMHKTADVTGESYDPEERLQVVRLLNENLFTYDFQPIVDAKTGFIYAYEALMRSGSLFKISPISILNHAQALDRLLEIEKYTMGNVFGILKKNIDNLGNKLLFINSIPSCTLSDSDFEELYKLYGDVMDRAVIEFTEQTEASEQQLATLLERSKRTGLKIAVDDYGTGYSNISNLLTFMPNCVKIDRSLIMNIHKDKRKQHFTKNIIDYAHDNNFMALAEGVELSEELKTVISMGADLIQGYYTGRPSPEFVTEIRREVFDEIREYNRLFENKRPRKTFFAGAEKEISLITLDFDNYTEIIVSKSEYTLKGTPNYSSEIVVRVIDGIECKLNLVDADMKNESASACIIVGKNSRVTLNICGSVNISGSIEVPETAELEVVGSGSLSISSTYNHTYAIGTSHNRSHGSISIKLDNRLGIHLESDKSIAIGGGFNGSDAKICIEAKEFMIEQLGKESIGIGSLNGDSDVTIRNTNITMISHSAENLLIGSKKANSVADLENCKLKVVSSGDLVCFAGSRLEGNSRIRADKCDMSVLLNGKTIHAFGSDEGSADVEFTSCTLDVHCSGAAAVAVGSNSHKGRVRLSDCAGQIFVNSGTYYVFGCDDKSLLLENNSIEIHENE
ncbi:MAG: EAL domain-containing protein [Oscillospiraceae bacterium]